KNRRREEKSENDRERQTSGGKDRVGCESVGKRKHCKYWKLIDPAQLLPVHVGKGSHHSTTQRSIDDERKRGGSGTGAQCAHVSTYPPSSEYLCPKAKMSEALPLPSHTTTGTGGVSLSLGDEEVTSRRRSQYGKEERPPFLDRTLRLLLVPTETHIFANKILLIFYNAPRSNANCADLPPGLGGVVFQCITHMAYHSCMCTISCMCVLCFTCVDSAGEDPGSRCHGSLDEPFAKDLFEFGL
ncbi:hypothetical protein FQN60_017847, partial [Etheostoma spectabile]